MGPTTPSRACRGVVAADRPWLSYFWGIALSPSKSCAPRRNTQTPIVRVTSHPSITFRSLFNHTSINLLGTADARGSLPRGWRRNFVRLLIKDFLSRRRPTDGRHAPTSNRVAERNSRARLLGALPPPGLPRWCND